MNGCPCVLLHSLSHSLTLTLTPLPRSHGTSLPFSPLSQAQVDRLRLAASAFQNKALAALVETGVGFHNAAISGEDRALVEGLFLEGVLPVRAMRTYSARVTTAQRGWRGPRPGGGANVLFPEGPIMSLATSGIFPAWFLRQDP
jgi:hypothetical protein